MAFEILDAADRDQCDRWLALWNSWPEREVQAHPSYVRLFAREGDLALCAVWRSEAGGALLPLVLRPLRTEPWAGIDRRLWDFTSPYGYGGPYCWNLTDPDVDAFWKALGDWAEAQHVVSGFVRLSLFPEQRIPVRGKTVDVSPNLVRRLDLTPDALWADYEHKVRKNVNKARRSGLTVEFDDEGHRLDEFLSLYYETLDRNNAGAGYYFPRSFFETIRRELPGQFVFCHVDLDGHLLSTELVLVSKQHLYSFLGGTSAEGYAQRPNDLLKHAVMEWGIDRGMRAYVLGGGYEGRDGIFRYKRSFAPNGEVSFKAARLVFDQASYEALVAERRRWEMEHGTQREPTSQFFPEYRA